MHNEGARSAMPALEMVANPVAAAQIDQQFQAIDAVK
jgi:hypothetical protein